MENAPIDVQIREKTENRLLVLSMATARTTQHAKPNT